MIQRNSAVPDRPPNYWHLKRKEGAPTISGILELVVVAGVAAAILRLWLPH